MKTNYLKLLLCFTIAITSSFSCYSQEIKPKQLLKKVDAALNNIETLVYKINRKDKSFTNKPTDTLYRVAICSLYTPDREIKKFVIDVFREDNTLQYFKCDGTYLASLYYKKDSLDTSKKIRIEYGWDPKYNHALSMTRDYNLRDYFEKKRAFRQYNSLLAKLFLIKEIVISEGTFMDTPVYILTAYTKNLEKRRNYIDYMEATHYIRKSDFLPIGYKNTSKLDNMIEYEYYEIEYLKINSKLPLESFEVDINVREIKPREMYDRIKEYEL